MLPLRTSLIIAIPIIALCVMPWTGSYAQPGTSLVVVGSVEQAAVIEEVSLSGTVTSPRVAKLSTEVDGLVKSVQVDAGDRIEAGDVLLKLDMELEQLSLEAVRAATEQAKEQFDDAKRRLADTGRLAKRQTVSANELQSLEAEVGIDNAVLKRFSAEQRRQEARLRRHALRAPFAGVISYKYVEAGEWVQPGDAVLELVATDGLRIDFQAPQAVFAKVSLDSEVRIKLDAVPDQQFDGKIQSIVPVSDPTARMFLMRVTLADSGPPLMPGMSASGLLRLRTGESGVVVSRDAVVRYPDGRVTVWVVSEKGESATVSEHQVKTGLSFNGRIAILEGLDAGARVILEGNEALKEGQAIVIQRSE